MKIKISNLIAYTIWAACAIFVSTSSVSALTYSVTSGSDQLKVGNIDTYIASTNLGNSSDADELDWIYQTLGFAVTFDNKLNTPSGAGWTRTNESLNTYALKLTTSPEYFMIKTGNTGIYNHFLFKNQESLDWAVVNLSESFGTEYSIRNIGKFSHIVEASGNSTPVPEPGTMVLLGAGLFGLAVWHRRRANR